MTQRENIKKESPSLINIVQIRKDQIYHIFICFLVSSPNQKKKVQSTEKDARNCKGSAEYSVRSSRGCLVSKGKIEINERMYRV